MKINLANTLTFLRMALALPVLFFMSGKSKAGLATALVLFCAAALTDLFDGMAARSQGTVSDFGKFLDPLADKVLVLTVLAGFAALKTVPAWMVAVIVLRDIAVSFARSGNAGRYVPGIFAKSKTAVQMCAVVMIFLFGILMPGSKFAGPAIYYAMLFVTVVTVLSGIGYFFRRKA